MPDTSYSMKHKEMEKKHGKTFKPLMMEYIRGTQKSVEWVSGGQNWKILSDKIDKVALN